MLIQANRKAFRRRADVAAADGALSAPRVAGLPAGFGADGAPVRLGIMGGTFDPVHTGHLACAEMARDACGMRAVLFVPAGMPSFKRGMRMAPAAARLDMCALAVAGNPAFSTSPVEVDRAGVTYTSDTLERLRADLPDNVALDFIIGTDSLLTLPDWHEAETVAALARVVCVSRPGYVEDAALMRRLDEMGFDVAMVSAPLLDISSSEVRRRVAAGATVRYLCPDAVCDYIAARGLYADDARRERR